MDNRVAERPGKLLQKGRRFFLDDEDDFELEDILQALCFMEVGETFVPAKPWEHGTMGKRVLDLQTLSPSVRKHIERLLDEEERSDQDGSGNEFYV